MCRSKRYCVEFGLHPGPGVKAESSRVATVDAEVTNGSAGFISECWPGSLPMDELNAAAQFINAAVRDLTVQVVRTLEPIGTCTFGINEFVLWIK